MHRIFVAALLAALAGCAATGSGLTAFERERLAEREKGLAMATQRVHDPATLAHLAGLIARIAPGARLRLYVLEHEAPQAELIGGEVVLVRTGLLRAARSDDELAFVLAHEIGHGALGHLGARRQATWDARAAEIAADAWARDRLSALGWSTEAGPALLARLLPGLPDAAQPLVRERLSAMGRGPGQEAPPAR